MSKTSLDYLCTFRYKYYIFTVDFAHFWSGQHLTYDHLPFNSVFQKYDRKKVISLTSCRSFEYLCFSLITLLHCSLEGKWNLHSEIDLKHAIEWLMKRSWTSTHSCRTSDLDYEFFSIYRGKMLPNLSCGLSEQWNVSYRT